MLLWPPTSTAKPVSRYARKIQTGSLANLGSLHSLALDSGLPGHTERELSASRVHGRQISSWNETALALQCTILATVSEARSLLSTVHRLHRQQSVSKDAGRLFAYADNSRPPPRTMTLDGAPCRKVSVFGQHPHLCRSVAS